jgi:hypothetical protein
MSTPLDDWLALDAETRQAVRDNASQFLAHPDPHVSAVAARYARNALDEMPRRIVRAPRVLWTLGTCCLLASAVVFVATPSIAAWLLLIMGFVFLILDPVMNRRRSRAVGLWRIEEANRLALGGAEVIAAAPGTSGATDSPALTMRYVLGRIATDALPAGLASCSLSAAYWAATVSQHGPAMVVMLVLAVVFTGYTLVGLTDLAFTLVPWVLPGRPVMRLDAAGVHRYLPPSFDLPWSEVAEVRLFPMRVADRGDRPATIVAIVPSDPAMLERMRVTGRQRGVHARFARSYGTPLLLADQLVDHSAEQIAAVTSALADVPVRQF